MNNNETASINSYKITFINDTANNSDKTVIIDKVFATTPRLAYAEAYAIADDLNQKISNSNWKIIEIANVACH